MPWILELGERSRAMQGARERLTAAVPGLSPGDDVSSDDLVGVIICDGPSRALLDALREATCTATATEVLVVAPRRSGLDPWETLAAGAADVLEWDGDPAPVAAAVQRRTEVARLLARPEVGGVMVGHSSALRQALRDVVVAARFAQGPILVLGETGTGKELAARVVHAVRTAVGVATGRLVVVDCTTIVPALSGSELFGHEKGAFTGAVSVRTGAFAAADGGTMLLDEIGDLPLELQPELLRVVQEGTYKPVGSDSWRRSRARLVCATHRDLVGDVDMGRFRADLYYRLAVSTVVLPPLRERREDVVPLFTHFIGQALGQAPGEGRARARRPVAVTPAVADVLLRRAYPGNLRDLRQLAYRVAARHVGPGPVTPGDLPPADRPVPVPTGFVPFRPAAPVSSVPPEPDDGAAPQQPGLEEAVRAAVGAGASLKGLREQVADLAVDAALDESGGSVRAAAARLGVTERALHLRRAQRRNGSSPDASEALP
jgi:transcriptional regulator with GAF, ATPase, and Fis domain